MLSQLDSFNSSFKPSLSASKQVKEASSVAATQQIVSLKVNEYQTNLIGSGLMLFL